MDIDRDRLLSLIVEAVSNKQTPAEHLEWAADFAVNTSITTRSYEEEALIVANELNDPKSDFHTRLIDRLFYYCEGHGAWLPLDKDIAGYEQFNADMQDGEEYNLRIKRIDMTEAKYLSMPDIS